MRYRSPANYADDPIGFVEVLCDGTMAHLGQSDRTNLWEAAWKRPSTATWAFDQMWDLWNLMNLMQSEMSDDIPKWKLKEVLAVHEFRVTVSFFLYLGFQLYHAPILNWCQFSYYSNKLQSILFNGCWWFARIKGNFSCNVYRTCGSYMIMDTSCTCRSTKLAQTTGVEAFLRSSCWQQGFCDRTGGEGTFRHGFVPRSAMNIEEHPASSSHFHLSHSQTQDG